MKGQNWWIIALGGFLLVLITVVRSSNPVELLCNQRFPDKNETEVCGSIRDVIERNSERFRQILIRNTNDRVDYIDDDARRMTSRTKNKLDVLASLVSNEWQNDKVRVIRAWTDQVVALDPASLHFEGRSLSLQTENFHKSKLTRLAGLAIEAGFDWVKYDCSNYVRASVIQDTCQIPMDLVFVLDNSGSVGDRNFTNMKDFVKNVIDFFNIGENNSHVAVVTYDTDTSIEFNLVKYFTKNEIRNAVDDIKYHGFLSYTGEALNAVRQKVLNKAAGMRVDDGIPKVLLLLTDGYSNGIQPLGPALQLQDLGVSIFSIGVGYSVSVSELKEIASDPDEKYVLTLSSFNQLINFVDRVSYILCRAQTPDPVSNITVSPSRYSAIVTWAISTSTQNSSIITKIIIYLNNKKHKTIPRGTQVTIYGLIPYTWYLVGIQTQDGSSLTSEILYRTFRTNEAVECLNNQNSEELQIGLLVSLVVLVLCFLLSFAVNIYQRRLIQTNNRQTCLQSQASANDSQRINQTTRSIEVGSEDSYMNDDGVYESACSEPELSTGQSPSTYMSLNDKKEPDNVYQSLQHPNIQAVEHQNPVFTSYGEKDSAKLEYVETI